MTIPATLQRLEKSVSFYLKAIALLSHHGMLDEQRAHAFQVMIYINTNIDFIRKNEIYAPIDELHLLLDATQKFLKKNERDTFSGNDIVEDLASNLYLIYLLLKKRKVVLPEDLYKKIAVVFNEIENNFSMIYRSIVQKYTKLPEGYSFLNLNTSQPELDKKTIMAHISRWANQVSSDGFFDLLLDQKIPQYHLLRMTYDYSEYCKEMKRQKLTSTLESISDDDPDIKIYTGILLFIYQTELYSWSKKQIIDSLQSLAGSYSDKETFVNRFLFICQNLYDAHMPLSNPDDANDTSTKFENALRIDVRNSLLESVTDFFPMLDALLPPNKLSELVANDFFIPHVESNENLKSYEIYRRCLSFYISLANDPLYDDCGTQTIFRCRLDAIFQRSRLVLDQLVTTGRGVAEHPSETSAILSILPPLLQINLNSEQLSGLKKEFESFVTLFLEVNTRAGDFQKRNIKILFSQHQPVIIQLIKIMGIVGIKYLRSHLAVTALHLERRLSSIPALPEEIQTIFMGYFQENKHLFESDRKKQDAFIDSIIILDALVNGKNHCNLNYNIEAKIVVAYSESLPLPGDKSIEDYRAVLAKNLLNTIFNEIGITLCDEEVSIILHKFSIKNIISVILARKNITNDYYRLIYLHLLKRDFIDAGSYDFLHNIEQEDLLGKGLSVHNQAIRNRLSQAKIDPEKALSYTIQSTFTVLPKIDASSDVDFFQIIKGDILKLKEVIDTNAAYFSSSTKINALNDLLAKFLRHTELTNTAKKLLGTINANLSAINVTAEQPIEAKFIEFAQHIKERCDAMKQSKHDRNNEDKEYTFKLEQWKKEKMNTFFLGDDVGCCLASTGAHFQAIVQRRMDDAMLFHVAIDQKTENVAALIWLYLAERFDNTVVLVANFFEINAKYATNNTLRLRLLSELLQFTGQYCQDNNITAFYMAPLNYGWFRNDLHDYPLKEVALLDKLGGAYIPIVDPAVEITYPNKERTQGQYYLPSLSSTMFHEYTRSTTTFLSPPVV